MNTNTLEKLRKLKFYGMFHAFKSSLESGKTNDYTADELLAHLVDAEWDDRNNRRVERQILYARFRYKAMVENIHYHADRSIDRNQIMRLAECSFIGRNENLLITGSTGIGKKLCSICDWSSGMHTWLPRNVCQYSQIVCQTQNGQGGWILYQRNYKNRTAATAYPGRLWYPALRCPEPGSTDGNHRRQARKNIPDNYFSVAC
jgi:hypothetical protein